MVAQAVDVDLFQGDGAKIGADEDGISSQAPEPLYEILGIGDAAAEEKQLGLGPGERHAQLVVETTIGVGEHLVFVDDQQSRSFSPEQAVLLGFECCDQNRGVQIFGEVAGGDAGIPAARAPLGQLVVRKGTSRDGVNGLAAIFALVGPKLENECFTGAGRCLDNNVFAGAESGDGFLLP